MSDRQKDLRRIERSLCNIDASLRILLFAAQKRRLRGYRAKRGVGEGET